MLMLCHCPQGIDSTIHAIKQNRATQTTIIVNTKQVMKTISQKEERDLAMVRMFGLHPSIALITPSNIYIGVMLRAHMFQVESDWSNVFSQLRHFWSLNTGLVMTL